jgi:hypothetical protein
MIYTPQYEPKVTPPKDARHSARPIPPPSSSSHLGARAAPLTSG